MREPAGCGSTPDQRRIPEPGKADPDEIGGQRAIVARIGRYRAKIRSN